MGQFPRTEQRAYAFQYRDTDSFEPEIDEWFHYTELEQDRAYLLASREAFEQKWKAFCQAQHIPEEITWIITHEDRRLHFVSDLAQDLRDEDYATRTTALSCVYYILTGVWSSTSGLEPREKGVEDEAHAQIEEERINGVQIQWMHKGADIVRQSSIIPELHSCLVQAAKAPDAAHPPSSAEGEETNEGAFSEDEFQELGLCLSCFYLLVESARARVDMEAGLAIRQTISTLQPNFLVFLTRMISRLRWDDSYNIPLMHALQLFWKSLLLIFGGVTEHLEKIKSILQPRVDPFSTEAAHPVLTASPLDYHMFRQEITSKYPAYNPPLPLIPLETDQKTMLPPLPQHSTRQDAIPGVTGHGTSGLGTHGSIFHQPVHIATPAPSPPPSPIGPGGKAAKKQNYQTNQNFPFLYPPLDDSSNIIGGKGSTELQDLMVGKKWEGSDVPRSIIEAGELFASRMRMTRAMRQLWRERDLFMKYERGWLGDLTHVSKGSEDDDQRTEEEKEIDSLDDPQLRDRMRAVEDYFREALPDLQSLVIVMMKVMLTNVQDIALRNGGFQDPTQQGGLNRTKSNPNMTQNQSLPIPPPPPRPEDMALEDLDNVRSREISQKAVSGAIFLMLKWFKVSHVLKFEYLTQLLLDSNYVQLTLKYFAHQNLEDLVAFKYDRDDLSFWHYCHIHSDHPPLSPTSPDERSETSSVDEAMPPPISRHRRSPTSRSDVQPAVEQGPSQEQMSEGQRPSVDELGNPLGPLPTTPITTYSFRQFQTAIHLLRSLQKVTRGKAHRILFLVQFKSSQILRRILRVPDTTLRLYVLKLFKSQVPYCGRKWRQSNMRVITAIYLHCRPELRDEWLAGMHDANVEGEVDEAVPLEWALRGLTFWWQKRMYPDAMRREKRRGKPKSKKSEKAPKLPEMISAPAPIGAEDTVDVDVDKLMDTDIPETRLDDLDDDEDDDGGDEEEGGQEIDDDERDFFRRELDAIGWGLAGLRLGEGSEDVAFGEEALGINVNGAGGYSGANGAEGVEHAEQSTGLGTPLTPIPQLQPHSRPQPQWVVADAASLENWQNG